MAHTEEAPTVPEYTAAQTELIPHGSNPAQQVGHQDGLNDGRSDRQSGHSSRATEQQAYQSADHNYSPAYGDRQQSGRLPSGIPAGIPTGIQRRLPSVIDFLLQNSQPPLAGLRNWRSQQAIVAQTLGREDRSLFPLRRFVYNFTLPTNRPSSRIGESSFSSSMCFVDGACLMPDVSRIVLEVSQI